MHYYQLSSFQIDKAGQISYHFPKGFRLKKKGLTWMKMQFPSQTETQQQLIQDL
jgi:hypothetical protein